MLEYSLKSSVTQTVLRLIKTSLTTEPRSFPLHDPPEGHQGGRNSESSAMRKLFVVEVRNEK